MAVNSEVCVTVPMKIEEHVYRNVMKWNEERRKESAWQAMQSKPNVEDINKMNWFPVCHKWCSIGESLGISKGVMEEIIRRDGLLPGIHRNSLCDIHTRCNKAMLIKWLNETEGTGHSERTWITIAKAVKDVGLGEVAFKLLEKVVEENALEKNSRFHIHGLPNIVGVESNLFENAIRFVLHGPPTLQELEDTIVHHLGEEWRSVGNSLGMSPEVMKEIGSKFGNVPTQCSEAMFSKWLNREEGTGHKERTWGTVLTALEDAGREDLGTAVLDELIVKYDEESLRAAPNIDDLRVLIIPHVLLMWRVLGLQLGIHEAILSAIESDARKNRSILSKQAIEMFRLWLDGVEGTGDQDRSWSTILKALIEIGLSGVSIKVLKHFDPTATPKDIGQALSQLSENTQLLSDDITTISSDPVPMASTPVPTTSQVTAETSLDSPSFNDDVGQVSLHDCKEVDGEVEEDKGYCSKSLSESSGSEVYTDPLPRLGSKRSCSEGSMGESSHATVEESTSTHHPPQSNGDHFTWSEPKRRRLEEVSDDEHRDVIRKHWTRCVEGLDCAVIKDHLWDSHLITYSDRKRIKQAVSTEDANEVVLDRLYTSATPPRLLEFAQLLQTREPLTYSRNVKIGKEIESSLMEIVENTS